MSYKIHLVDGSWLLAHVGSLVLYHGLDPYTHMAIFAFSISFLSAYQIIFFQSYEAFNGYVGILCSISNDSWENVSKDMWPFVLRCGTLPTITPAL